MSRMLAPEEPTVTAADGATDEGGARRQPVVRAVLPWLVAVLAIAAALYSTIQWRSLAGQQDLVDSARAAAIAFAHDLTNWDASDGLDDEIDALRARGTGPFLDEIAEVFGGDELAADLRFNAVRATGEVEEAFVQRMEGTLAEVFTVVSVTYASPDLPALQPVTFPASIVMNHVDGTWLVREVTVPHSIELGQMMVPPGGGS